MEDPSPNIETSIETSIEPVEDVEEVAVERRQVTLGPALARLRGQQLRELVARADRVVCGEHACLG